MNIEVEIDKNSGFCFGVIRAIEIAEKEVKKNPIFSLGDLVHNEQEMNRLRNLGLKSINYQDFLKLHHSRVLFRAHGEPPQIYQLAVKNKNEIVDASCPVVLNLQKKIRDTYIKIQKDGSNAQIVILGKVGHAEVVGLQGQTDNKAVVIQNENELSKIDFAKQIFLFSQTTASQILFDKVVSEIEKRVGDKNNFIWTNSICKNMANRVQHLKDFVSNKDKVVFVGGHHSSNAQYLFEQCKTSNANSFYASDADEKELKTMFTNARIPSDKTNMRIGICGATSTPQWLMERVKEEILRIAQEFNNNEI